MNTEIVDQKQFETNARLAGIFTPYAATRQKMLQENNIKLAHYTTVENAMLILNSKQMWLRDTRCMIDYLEVVHGHGQLRGWFGQDANSKAFLSEFELVYPGVAQEAINLFDQSWQHIPTGTFITCLSEHTSNDDPFGRLSMWRAFGRTVGGVAIILNLPLLRAVNDLNIITLSPVAYFSPEEVAAEISKVIQNVRREKEFLKERPSVEIKNWIFHMLAMASVSLKHKGFSEEKEWRAIYFSKVHPTNLLKRETETIGGVPQIVYKVPLEDRANGVDIGLGIPGLLHKLIIGPSAFPWSIRDAFIEKLQQLGVSEAESKIVVSDIPIRA